MDVDAYLARIGHAGDRTPSAATLAVLQQAHLEHVPYENLDTFFVRAHTLAPDALFRKIVANRRGGYCFELNGLFNLLLRDLGFTTREYFARWLEGEPPGIPARRHRVIRVAAGGRDWLADVGVGQRAPRMPLEYVCDRLQVRDGRTYRIVRDADLGFVLERQTPEGFVRIYSWDEAPAHPVDFEYAHYALTHDAEHSPFRKSLLVHLHVPGGTKSILSPPPPEGFTRRYLFLQHLGERRILRDLAGTAELVATLRAEFGIEFPMEA